jgi:hypothetical protein
MIGVGLLLAVIFLSHDALRLAGAFGCILVLIYAYIAEGENARTVRSFFGVHKIYETRTSQIGVRVLMHGTTIHGAQVISGDMKSADGRPATITYFGPQSPMAKLFDAVKEKKDGPIRAAVVGLGAGMVACYMREQDTLDFYEIDQTVVDIATDPATFEFVSACKPDAKIVVGDARLTLADAEDGYYDLIVMDAFSSDAVPVHLLTREAVALYLRKLAPGRRHRFARDESPSGIAICRCRRGIGERLLSHASCTPAGRTANNICSLRALAAVARSDEDFGPLLQSGDWFVQEPDPRQWVWTDNYSNIIGAVIRHLRN